jgi:hypothetical protein
MRSFRRFDAAAGGLGRQGAALMLGAVAGLGAAALGLPLPWIIGPMILCTLAAVAGLPIAGPARLRPLVAPVIGVMIGSGITAPVLAGLWEAAGAVLLLLAMLPAMMGASWLVYRRVGKADPATAWFSAMPGGLNDMLILGDRAGGQGQRIALAHASRILVVISLVVLAYGLIFGAHGGSPTGSWIALGALTVADGLILTSCAVIGALAGDRLGLPAAPIFGPMILSGAVHVLGWVTVPPPTLVVILAQIVVGTIIGCRFLGVAPRVILRDIGLGTLASVAMIAVALVFAALAAPLAGKGLSQTFLAFAPGGLTEMSLIALAMGQDPAFVTALHILRLVLVIGLADWVWRRWIDPDRDRP